LAPHGAGRFHHHAYGGEAPVNVREQSKTIQPKQKIKVLEPKLAEATPPQLAHATLLHCSKAHLMEAKVVREVWNKISWWHYQTDCDVCGNRITSKDGRYYCKDCKYSVCLECSSKVLANNPAMTAQRLPPTSALYAQVRNFTAGPERALPGDILLCGPDQWGVHHCIMIIGMMKRDPVATKVIKESAPELEGMDIFSCHTIECSARLRGQDSVWYPAMAYFARNRKTGEATMVADIPDGEEQIELISPVKVKLLLHPCRPGHSGPEFDATTFRKAVETCAEMSQKWSLRTAANGVLNRRKIQSLDIADYPDPRSRQELLEEIHKRWDNRPICTSVIIMVWQRYFEMIAGSGPQAADMAVQNILRWMPLLSDKTLPSALIKELSKCGWVIRGNLDA
jgi:hypothetical protein